LLKGFRVCSKASPRDYRGLRASHLEGGTVFAYQVTTIELNEPVAPEFRDILREELFQTSRNCSDPQDMSFDMPRLSFDMPRAETPQDARALWGQRRVECPQPPTPHPSGERPWPRWRRGLPLWGSYGTENERILAASIF
jgi:hypothetical protein